MNAIHSVVSFLNVKKSHSLTFYLWFNVYTYICIMYDGSFTYNLNSFFFFLPITLSCILFSSVFLYDGNKSWSVGKLPEFWTSNIIMFRRTLSILYKSDTNWNSVILGICVEKLYTQNKKFWSSLNQRFNRMKPVIKT